VSMSSWQRRRRLTSLRALEGTTSVIHTCRKRRQHHPVVHSPVSPLHTDPGRQTRQKSAQILPLQNECSRWHGHLRSADDEGLAG
jgi:hypothetical protein